MSSNAAALSDMLILERASILRRLARIVGSEPAAEDVAQSLYLRVQKIDDSIAIVNKKSFLFRLASNLAIDHVRAERTRDRIQAEADAFLWADFKQLCPEQIVAAEAELQQVLAAARALPEPTRSIFRMHRFDGMRQSDVAARLGVSLTTVEKHVRRALDILRSARDKGC